MDTQTDRRKFLEFVAQSGGASPLAAGAYAPQARATGTTEAAVTRKEMPRLIKTSADRDQWVPKP